MALSVFEERFRADGRVAHGPKRRDDYYVSGVYDDTRLLWESEAHDTRRAARAVALAAKHGLATEGQE